MSTSTFYSDNSTGTYADTLKMVGIAETVAAWYDKLGYRVGPIRLADCGGYYRIDLPRPLGMDDVAAVPAGFFGGRGLPLVTSKPEKPEKSKRSPAWRPNVGYPYDLMREERDRYVALREKLLPDAAARARYAKNPRAGEFRQLEEIPSPDPDLGLYGAISHFKIADSYNALCQRWIAPDDLDGFRQNLEQFLAAFSAHPNALPARPETASALQITNPASGKGNNAAKIGGLTAGGIGSFWLIEYLKFVGFFTIAAPILVSGSKDRKTFVLRPTKIDDLSALRDVMRDFRGAFSRSTAVKVDILAALRFTRTLIEHIARRHAARQTDPGTFNPFGIRPRVTDIASGFDVAFYKDMGSAYATMNLATINLPGWLGPITSREVADDALAFLKEHEQIVANIKQIRRIGGRTTEDEGSDEIELLRRYRDFLSGNDAMRFFEFAARYGDYYLAKQHRKQWAAQLTTDGMETLMAQSQDKETFTPILQDEGFRAIATAIRFSTVVAQYRAARGSGYPYEVRYGLGQDLLRAAAYPKDFLARLSEFVQSYNAENARIDERLAKGSMRDAHRRPSVRAGHLDALVALLDRYDGNSELICKMLVAYGYARDPRAPDDPGATSTDEPITVGILSDE